MRYTWDVSHRQRVTILTEDDGARLEVEVDGVLAGVSGSRDALGRFLLIAVGLVGGEAAFDRANRLVTTTGDAPAVPPTTTDA